MAYGQCVKQANHLAYRCRNFPRPGAGQIHDATVVSFAVKSNAMPDFMRHRIDLNTTSISFVTGTDAHSTRALYMSACALGVGLFTSLVVVPSCSLLISLALLGFLDHR